MVNSKKMSKSSIAVIVLSILLVLSMILGLTGAWFTSKAETEDVNSPEFGFGLVKIESTGAASVTYTIASGDVTKMVDGDKITVADTLAITNSSNVDIYYVVDKAFTITVSEGATFTAEDLKTWLSLEAGDQSQKGEAVAEGAITLTGKAGDYTLASVGAANGKTGTFKITVSANVYAVQKGNIASDSDLQAAFQAAGYAGYASLELTQF